MDLKLIEEELSDCATVVDLGCGPLSPLRKIRGKTLIGVDVHEPSIELSRQRNIHNSYFTGTAEEFLAERGENSVDAIVMLDLIEHFQKSAGLRLLQVAEAVARKKVLIFTPSGFVPQPPTPENPWQEHKSGWTSSEFTDLGYRVVGSSGWKPMRGMYARWRRPKLLCALISKLSEPIVRHYPDHAFALHAIKSLKKTNSSNKPPPSSGF